MYIVWCTAARYWKNKLVKRSKMTNLQFIPDALDRKGLLSALRAFKKGDFSVRLPMDLIGIDGEIAQVFNEVVEVNEKVSEEVARVARAVRTDGEHGRQAQVPGAAETWKDLADTVFSLAANLTGQRRNIAAVATADAKVDLSREITVDVRGGSLELKSTINT